MLVILAGSGMLSAARASLGSICSIAWLIRSIPEPSSSSSGRTDVGTPITSTTPCVHAVPSRWRTVRSALFMMAAFTTRGSERSPVVLASLKSANSSIIPTAPATCGAAKLVPEISLPATRRAAGRFRSSWPKKTRS